MMCFNPIAGKKNGDPPMTPPTDPAVPAPPAPGPVCPMFRSRGMHQYAGMEHEIDIEQHDGEVYCLHTFNDVGPDKAEVARKACRPGRSCYPADT